MQNFGGQTKSIMTFLKVAYSDTRPQHPLKRPFPNSPQSHFQSDSKCEIFVMAISSNKPFSKY